MAKRSAKGATLDPFPPYDAPEGLSHLIPIVFGDWSSDGHGHNSRTYVWSNKGTAAWRKALAEGEAKAGVTLEDIAGGFEDRTIQKETFESLKARGFEAPPNSWWDPGERDTLEIDLGYFEELFFYLVSLGDSTLSWSRLDAGAHHQEVHPGGYGLF